jgi:CheY-like chemotaxis protein
LPFILADGSQLHQVLVNLCVNARDAMPQGGTLCISAHCESGQMIRQRRMDMNAAKYVAISVSDTGIGMDQKTLERIFEPFFTTKGPGKGTGLGLSTVHGIIANHNGFIEVKSQPGEGTTFTVFLPAPVEDEPNKASDTEDMTGLKGGNETILVIEDEDYIVELLNSVLRRFGYQTLIAKDGIAGIETYKKEMDKIALVLSDVGLPRMTGESVLKRLRELNPQVKVILASGFLDPEQKSDLFKAGLAGFLQKPFLPALLLKTIREILDNRP